MTMPEEFLIYVSCYMRVKILKRDGLDAMMTVGDLSQKMGS